MALFPSLCKVALLDAAPLSPRITPRLIVVHTNGGPGTPDAIRNYFNRPGNSVYSHFDVGWDGAAVQMQDTGRTASAQWDANPYAVSIETQDDRNPLRPWTDAQLAKIVALIRAIAAAHSIPLRLADRADGSGIGWHSMYPAWNHSAHNCPGPVREAQLRLHVIPALTAPTPPGGLVMDAEVKAAFAALTAKIDNLGAILEGYEAPGHVDTDPGHASLRDVLRLVEAVAAKVGA